MKKLMTSFRAAVMIVAAAAIPSASSAFVGQGTGTLVQELRLYNLDGRILVVDDRELLALIGKHEARSDYDVITDYTRLVPEKPITSMTIREVLDFQDRVVANGATSSAMGMYQFIRKTLRSTAVKSGIGMDAVFDRYTQDRLARFALADCGYYRHDVPDRQIGDCLAGVWASLPLVQGSRAGYSRYQNYNGNRALTSVETVMRTVRGRFRDATPERLAEITRRGAGSLSVGTSKQPLDVTVMAMARTIGADPQTAMNNPWLIAMAVGDIPSPFTPDGTAWKTPQNAYGASAAGYVARRPDPEAERRIEDRRRMNRILYGDDAGIASEKLVSHGKTW